MKFLHSLSIDGDIPRSTSYGVYILTSKRNALSKTLNNLLHVCHTCCMYVIHARKCDLFFIFSCVSHHDKLKNWLSLQTISKTWVGPHHLQGCTVRSWHTRFLHWTFVIAFESSFTNKKSLPFWNETIIGSVRNKQSQWWRDLFHAEIWT